MGKKKRQRKMGKQAEETGGSEMTKFYVILGVVAVIGVGAVGYSVGTNAFGAAVTEPVVLEGVEDNRALVEMAQGVTKGEADAPITIVEFGDYQCPGCRDFARIVEPQLMAEFVETGEARFVYYDLPLVTIHPNAFLAARASRCAQDQGMYWEYHQALFQRQPDWFNSTSPTGQYVDYAGEVGLDEDTFEACLKSDRHADVVTANMRLAEQLGVSGTPTVMVSRGQGMARRVMQSNYEAIAGVVREMQEEIAEEQGAQTTESGGG